MDKYKVTGMSCAACQARVEKAVNAVPGVNSCAVSLLTNSMGVEGTASPDDIIQAVKTAGYGAQLEDVQTQKDKTEREDPLADTETPKLVKRLLWSVGFVLVLMYISMGHNMLHFPVPTFMENSPMTIGIIQAVLALIVIVINRNFFINGTRGILHASPNMDTLVALGSGVSFVFSCVLLYYQIQAQLAGDIITAHSYLHEFYFESAAMILALITVGKTLESKSKGRTTDALKGLMRLAPQVAMIEQDGKVEQVDVADVKLDTIFVSKTGSQIPVDGEIIEGHASLDESSLTGESIPAEKGTGEKVYAGTTLADGYVRCRATRVGEDTTLSQIIKLVSDAATTKAPIARIADKVSAVFVPVVILIAVATTLAWIFIGHAESDALVRGISVLVISCPCALGLATPVAIMVANGVGAKRGILFKNSEALEITGKTQIIVLDKTGTITSGQPHVTDIIPNEVHRITENQLLEYAYSVERMSEHPLAKAIVERAETSSVKALDLTDFKVLPGNGLTAKFSMPNMKIHIFGGNQRFIETKVKVPEDMLDASSRLAAEGKTPLFFSKANEFLGIIAVKDTIKEDSISAVEELKNLGLQVIMLTGDNERTADAIAREVGIDHVVAGVLPERKAAVVEDLKKQGHVMMVGDGINDAPALTVADVGVAVSDGSDVAIDAADIVLMNNRLYDVPAAIRLSRKTLRNIKENLFWAFIYNIIGIPLAAGVYTPLLGWELSPMFGAAAMSLSSVCVVSNALRLNFFKTKNTPQTLKEEPMNIIEITLLIDGMMCGHCEATVKQALEAIPEVNSAEVSHEAGKAVVKLNSEVDTSTLRNAVEEKGYTVTQIATLEKM